MASGLGLRLFKEAVEGAGLSIQDVSCTPHGAKDTRFHLVLWIRSLQRTEKNTRTFSLPTLHIPLPILHLSSHQASIGLVVDVPLALFTAKLREMVDAVDPARLVGE
jgi:hypothetical protein